MTVLALKLSRAANGVSELHGQVSRHMWQGLYPRKTVDQVPIGHITNGIHLLGWMKGPVRRFWRQKARVPDWEKDINPPEFWERMADPNFISDEETLGVALQAAPRIDRVRPPPSAASRASASPRAILSRSINC